MATNLDGDAPGSAGAGGSQQHPPSPHSVYNATAYFYEHKNAGVNDAWSAVTVIHPMPTEENFRKMAVAIEATPVYRASHMALGAPAGAAFLECRWCIILGNVEGRDTMELRRFLVPAVLILQENDTWDDLRRVFKNSLTDQQTGPYMATALMWFSWPAIYCFTRADGKVCLGGENAGEPLPPLLDHPGLNEGQKLLAKRPPGGPANSGQPSGGASAGLAASQADAKKSRVDLTGDDVEPVKAEPWKGLEVINDGARPMDVDEFLKQENDIDDVDEKADAAAKGQGPDWQGQNWIAWQDADCRIDVLVQKVVGKMKRMDTDWQDQLEELPDHKKQMIKNLAAHHKVVYASGKEPWEGLKANSKKMWGRLTKSLEEETAGDFTLTLKYLWDMEEVLIDFLMILKEGTGVSSSTLTAWHRRWKHRPVWEAHLKGEKGALKGCEKMWDILEDRLETMMTSADVVFTDVLEGLHLAEQSRVSNQIGNSLTEAVTHMMNSRNNPGGGQQPGRGYGGGTSQIAYQPYGGRGQGGGRGRGRGPPPQIPPELMMPQAFVNTHINGPRGTADNRCMTHMRALLKGTPPCNWRENCRNGSHEPATPKGAQALLAAWEAAGRPDRFARQNAT